MGFTPEQIKGRIKSVAKQNNGLSKWSERKPSTSLKRGVSLMSRLQLRAIRLMLRVPVFWTRSLAAW